MYYKRVYSKEVVSNKEAKKQNKLICLYNQLNGTSYTLDSVGIEIIYEVNPSNYTYGKPDNNFGWYTRTGIPYKKDLPELTKKNYKEGDDF